ncbi:MAG: hypothetical protein AAF502_19165 [Bacteroidota bacterium]
MKNRLERGHLKMEVLLGDTGFSSGENYQFLDDLGLDGYIPPHGQYKSKRPHFVFNQAKNCYICRNGKELEFRKTVNADGYMYNRYRTTKADCVGCSFRDECLGKSTHKEISIPITGITMKR